MDNNDNNNNNKSFFKSLSYTSTLYNRKKGDMVIQKILLQNVPGEMRSSHSAVICTIGCVKAKSTQRTSFFLLFIVNYDVYQRFDFRPKKIFQNDPFG